MAGNFTNLVVTVYDHTLNTLLATITNEMITASGSEAMSSVGDGKLEVMASSSAAAYLTEGNVVFATVIDSLSSLGFGICGFIIKNINVVPSVGATRLRVSGPVLLQELNYIDFGDDVIDDGAGGIAANDLAQAIAKAPSWSFYGGITGTTNGTYHTTTRGDSVLDVLREISKQSGGYFYMHAIGTAARELQWAQSVSYPGSAYVFTDDATAEDADTGVILKVTREESGDEIITRLYAFGAGSGDDRVTIAEAEGLVSVPAGYSVNWANSLITNTTLESTHAVVQDVQSFSSIRPADDSAEAIESAAIALFYTALNYITARSAAAVDYRITAVSHQRIRPGDTIEVMLDSDEYGTYDEIVVAQDITRYIASDGVLYFDIRASSRLIPYTFGAAGLSVAEYMVQAVHNLQSAIANNSNTPVGTTISTDHGALTGLTDDDHPQYLLEDGSRQLTGNLAVSAAVTIDGVDISVHAATPDAHHDPVTIGIGGLSAKLALSTQELTLGAINHSDISNVNPDDHHDPATAGSGIVVTGQQVGLDTPGTLSVSSANQATGNHTHAITADSNPGAAAALLKTDASGYLTLVKLNTDTIGDRSGGNLTLSPTGDIIINPTGNDVLPGLNYDINIGAESLKYLTLHVAELWANTLVAQEVLATIGGRIVVAPTTTLEADVGTGDTSITTRHNNLANNDYIILESEGKFECMRITSVPGGEPYTYGVTRNVDGSGANVWYAGDTVLNTGAVGDGFIDLYALSGLAAGSTAGPTIVGNVRITNFTYNGWVAHWAIGNLNGLYGYGADTYGAAFGKYSTTTSYITADATNGIRIMYGTNVLGQWDIDGDFTLGKVATNNANVYWDSSTQQLKFRGGTNGTQVQAYIGTDGSFVAGSGDVVLNADGITFQIPTDFTPGSTDEIKFKRSATQVSGISGRASLGGGGSSYNVLKLYINDRGTGGTETYAITMTDDSVAPGIHLDGPVLAGHGLTIGSLTVTPDNDTLALLVAASTPAVPGAEGRANIYLKGDKFIIQYYDAGTIRYKYLLLTGTGVTWVHTTTAP